MMSEEEKVKTGERMIFAAAVMGVVALGFSVILAVSESGLLADVIEETPSTAGVVNAPEGPVDITIVPVGN